MILTGPEIQRRIDSGEILISPFDPARINPNSYNLSLHNELLVYENGCNVAGTVMPAIQEPLDIKKPNPTSRISIPEDGLVINPGRLYLGRTVEATLTKNCVPMIEGRSSLGRLGIFIHITAGFGDVGFNGYWTLEMSCIHPVRIYPYIEICQIFYHDVVGDIQLYKSNKYQGNNDIQASMMYKDFEKE